MEWVGAAMRRACERDRDYNLDVRVVTYSGEVHPLLQQLERDFGPRVMNSAAHEEGADVVMTASRDNVSPRSAPPTCNAGHVLEVYDTEEDGYVCDMCKVTVS